MMRDVGHRPEDVSRDAEANCAADGQTVMFVAGGGKLAGLIGVADPIKETTPEAIRAAAHRRGAGRDADGRQSHDRICGRAKLGIDEVEAEVLPDRTRAISETAPAAGTHGRNGGRRDQ